MIKNRMCVKERLSITPNQRSGTSRFLRAHADRFLPGVGARAWGPGGVFDRGGLGRRIAPQGRQKRLFR